MSFYSLHNYINCQTCKLVKELACATSLNCTLGTLCMENTWPLPANLFIIFLNSNPLQKDIIALKPCNATRIWVNSIGSWSSLSKLFPFEEYEAHIEYEMCVLLHLYMPLFGLLRPRLNWWTAILFWHSKATHLSVCQVVAWYSDAVIVWNLWMIDWQKH